MASSGDGESGVRPRSPAPYDSASWWARCDYSFVKPLLAQGFSTSLNDSHLPELPKHDQVTSQIDGLEREWNREVARAGGPHPVAARNANGRAPSLWKAMYRAEKAAFWAAGWYCFLESATRVAQPVLLGAFLTWLTGDTAVSDAGPGLGWAAALSATAFAQAVVHHRLYYFTMRGGFNMRMAFTGLIHRKLLKLHAAALSGEKGDRDGDQTAQQEQWSVSDGKIVNIVSNDVMRFDNAWPALHFGWTAPLDFIAVVILMVARVGWEATFAGVAIVVVSIPLQLWMGRRMSRIRKRTAALTDKRVQLTNEAVSGILAVKAACWEPAFESAVSSLRRKERNWIFKSMLLKSANQALQFAMPYIATLLTFLVFWVRGGSLEISTVFSTMSLIHVLRLSLGKNMTRFAETLPEVLVSVRRFHRFLALPEKELPQTTASGEGAVSLENASFSWSLPKSVSSDPGGVDAVLSDVSFNVRGGQLLVIHGPTGSGKTALLAGIRGEVECVSGSVAVHGKVATVEQEPWIMAGTLRSNIVWDTSAIDEERYGRALTSCALRADLEQLPHGADTELGEKGVNLSGGQKARLSLARAVYADADVYLLDDPLSAVDPAVGAHLMEHVVLPLRSAGKAVILVTHHVHFARHADVVVRLTADGTVARVGAPSEDDLAAIAEQADEDAAELAEPTEVDGADAAAAAGISADDVAIAATEAGAGDGTATSEAGRSRAMSRGRVRSGSASRSRTRTLSVAESEVERRRLEEEKRRVALVRDEERSIGKVRLQTYVKYVLSAGVLPSILVLILFIGGQTVALLADFSLKLWAEEPVLDQQDSKNFDFFLAFTIATTVAGLVRAILFFRIGLRAATRLHDAAFRAVVHSPMDFFLSNPLGRVLNKFSSDLGQVDEQLPVFMFTLLTNLSLCVGSLVLACIAIPWVLIVVIPLIFVLIRVRAYFLATARALKRQESISKSPVFTKFSANLQGRATIRAYGAQQFVVSDFEEKLEANGRAWYYWLLGNRWVGYRLDMITFALLIAVVFGGAAFGSFDLVDHGLLAIAITYCIQLSGIFQFSVRLSARVETMMTSVERLDYYTKLPPESEPSESDAGAALAAAGTWPSKGRVALRDLNVRYRDDLPIVLRGVDLNIPGGSKVGIVGRTGSGKSSLTLAVCRLNEVCGGQVIIDGVDVASLPLSKLRSSIGVIPQTPTLFAGSLRRNVDPTSRFEDAEVWEALKAAGVDRLGGDGASGLSFHIEADGRNLSVGERQCVSMARALLLRARIYICDEATANVDYATDAKLQAMMRSHPVFAKATVLTVAHRLATVRDSDLIAVLEAGKVAECGPPDVLLAKGPEESAFARLVEAAEREESAQ